jgi:hypothetical protein
LNRGSEAYRLLMGSKSTGDDVGLRSPFLPTELKERKRKTPLVKQEKVEVGSHKMQIERLSSFCWTKWREQLSEGFFFDSFLIISTR